MDTKWRCISDWVNGDIPASYVGFRGTYLGAFDCLAGEVIFTMLGTISTSCYYVVGDVLSHFQHGLNICFLYKNASLFWWLFILRYFFGVILKVFGVIANSPISIVGCLAKPLSQPFWLKLRPLELPVEQSQHHAISISMHPFWVPFVHTGLFNHSADAEVEDGRMLMQRLWMRKRRTYLEIIATNFQSWHGMVEVWNPKTTETTGIIYLSNTFTKKRWNHCFLPKSQS